MKYFTDIKLGDDPDLNFILVESYKDDVFLCARSQSLMDHKSILEDELPQFMRKLSRSCILKFTQGGWLSVEPDIRRILIHGASQESYIYNYDAVLVAKCLEEFMEKKFPDYKLKVR